MELSLSPQRTLHIKLKKSQFIYFPDNQLQDPAADKEVSVLLYPHAQEHPQAGPRLVIDGAGEFEVDDLSIRGVDLNGGDGMTAYQLTSETTTVVLLPPRPAKAYTDAVLEAIGVAQVVVAVVPTSTPDYSAADAAKVVRLFEPQVVIPLSVEAKSEDLTKFLTELGSTEPRTAPVFKTKDLATLGEVMQIVVLES